MRIFESPHAWRAERRSQIREGRTLGFVPTMGALHDGHRSLVQCSAAQNDHTLVSIFVNPTQFDDAADLAQYPVSLISDIAALEQEHADFVFLPRADDLYSDGYKYRVSETDRSILMEGRRRPGHFDGVLTVVLKLLLIASADRAYFGEKDWQQLQLVQGMIDAFFLTTTLVACPTVREPDGLALSSRNRKLSGPDRELAPLLHHILSTSSSADAAGRWLSASGFAVEYVEEHDNRRLGAVRIGDVRLIDNVPLKDCV